MRFSLYLSFCSLWLFSCLAQDSLLFHFDDLVFRSGLEEELLVALKNDGVGYASFYVLSESTAEAVKKDRAVFEHKVTKFSQLKRPKKDEKYVQKIYAFVHEEFLRRYEALAYFHEIATSGVYNCVTACALYAMTFDKLAIPYVIKETPNHVYMVVYPETLKLVIETTDPVAGFRSFSLGFKEHFVRNLVHSKLIEESEGVEVDAAFDKYYFTDVDLNLTELLGIQYTNYALELLEQHRFKEAFEMLKKSYWLYPEAHTTELMLLAMSAYLDESKYTDATDYQLLAMIPKFGDDNFDDQVVVHEFFRLMNLRLTSQYDTAYVQEAYVAVSSALKDSIAIREIGRVYHYERGRLLYNKGEYLQALPFLESAYALAPEHVDIETLFVANINNLFAASILDEDSGLDLLDRLNADYPKLAGNKVLVRFRLTIYLMKMAEAYEARNEQTALRFKEEFGALYDERGSNVVLDRQLIGRAYSKGVAYHFRKGRYQSARGLINEGLKYAPDNGELRMRKLYLDTSGH